MSHKNKNHRNTAKEKSPSTATQVILPDEEQVNRNSERIAYLQMIQGPIDRMSTSSAVFKGFTATLVAGISALSFSNINQWVLILSLSPILCFAFLDLFYLRLERRYRYLYNQVRLNHHPIDFDLTPPKVKEIKLKEKKTNARIVRCILSTSIIGFYFPMIIISATVITLKLGGIL